MCKVDPHPSFGQSCTVWSYLKDRASDARWLANPIRISQYRRWRHLRVTLWWRHQSAFGGESKDSGLLMTSPPGTFWPGQVRPGEQAVMRKSTGSFEESNLRPSGGLTQYRPTKLTRRCLIYVNFIADWYCSPLRFLNHVHFYTIIHRNAKVIWIEMLWRALTPF